MLSGALRTPEDTASLTIHNDLPLSSRPETYARTYTKKHKKLHLLQICKQGYWQSHLENLGREGSWGRRLSLQVRVRVRPIWATACTAQTCPKTLRRTNDFFAVVIVAKLLERPGNFFLTQKEWERKIYERGRKNYLSKRIWGFLFCFWREPGSPYGRQAGF